MSLALLLVTQWLHILTGIVWFGGYVFLDFILWPALLRLPVPQARTASAIIHKFAGPIMASSGTLVVLLGIIRGTVLGPITSFRVLLTSPYGLTWLVALSISTVLIVWGAGWHDRAVGPIWDGDGLSPGIAHRLRLSTLFEMTSFGLVLACMVLLGVGL
jgi:uncharacterized membrane protein